MNRLTLIVLTLAAILAAGASSFAPAAATTASTTPATTATAAMPSPAAVVVLKGEIDDVSRDATFKRFAEAKAAGAKTIILKLDTPGGLVGAGLDLSRFLRSQSDVHVVAFVDRMAYSAGIMIGLACDELVMSPQSTIGDCAPIMLTEKHELQTLGETERAKIESPILADFYASSIRNGYDPQLTAAMVAMKRVVHFVQNAAGEKKFCDDLEFDKLLKDGWKPVPGVPDPVDRSDTLLTVQSDLAAKLGLSKGTYRTPQDFAAARGATIVATFEPQAGEQLLSWLSSDWLRGILISVLLMAIYAAFSHPGHGWFEAIALICLGVVVGVPLLTGYATWWEVVAILAGLVLLALELFVIPGFGFTGLLGIVLLFGGLILTFVGTEPSMPGVMPSLHGTWVNLQRGLVTVTIALGVSLLLWLWLQRYLPRLPYFNRLILTNVTGDTGAVMLERPVETGPAVGDIGVAVSELRPGGSVKFITESYPEGRIAGVVSESGYVPPGSTVVVKEVAGNRVVVRRES